MVDPDTVGITDSNPVGKEGALRTMPGLRALCPTATNSSHFSPLLSRRQLTPLTSLAATLMSLPRKCCKHKTYGKAKSFRCNTYKKPGGRVLLSILERPARIGHEDSASYSSSFFSHSCALFCTHQKLNSFVLNRFRTLCAKHVQAHDILYRLSLDILYTSAHFARRRCGDAVEDYGCS